MTSRCVIWARVSDEQESGNQLAELRQWAARRSLEVAAEYVLDGASAWKGEHREQIGQALANARLGRYDVVLCWALDRMSRDGVEATSGLLRRFHEAGAELLGAIYAGMARQESARRSERVRAGLARRKAAGLPVGRQPGSKDRRQRKRSGYVAAWEPGGKRREQERRHAQNGRANT